MLEHIANEPTLLEYVATCDETWTFSCDPEINHQSIQWKSPGSPRPKKARLIESTFKSTDNSCRISLHYSKRYII
ncbi:hypothetical protein TNCT_735421 [Trichonephila clavata]|uniref:Uncharacterized protein n=1 Tax=Trichonephila clavata TaxID=2740835 RepID=A0A8X6KUU5_TRICU|nr:hypothetical protein TNCT_735421 [Trichonephila clavata]